MEKSKILNFLLLKSLIGLFWYSVEVGGPQKLQAVLWITAKCNPTNICTQSKIFEAALWES